jgi:alanyl-tRNA synthetase
MNTSAQIRQQFLDFFASKQHAIYPSAPIVVKDDPTLMFTNAGMNQFKDFFLGNKPTPHTRIADTQKCLRVSGKHNDLEEVGVDHYHHTMFEMLGNWSFGDYFKEEAIKWSWELLTEVYKIPKDRLYVTVFEGDEKEGLPSSKVALQVWKQLVASDRIIYGNKKDNFWEMGDTGPCGPCSEIHVDTRPDEERKKIAGAELVNKDHPQVIEIWNNVFIQYNRKKDGSLEELPSKHVDTGMGFERLVRVLQNKNSNYDTDVFTPTITETEKLTGLKYSGDESLESIAFRVIADHIRAISFTIADGQLPSNTGAGYVIRRILRRAVRYYFTYLNYKQPLLHQLVPVLAKQFEQVFPEVYKQQDFLNKVILEEEQAFLRTLDSGLKRLNGIMQQSKASIQGNDAFELYDTYGFPLDLTKLIAKENNLNVDEPGFEQAMQVQKERSRHATLVDAQDWVVLQEKSNKFVGYNQLEIETEIVKYRKVSAKGKDSYQIVLAETPFYAESGGQVGDTGVLEIAGEIIKVENTKKDNDLIIHFTQAIPKQVEATVLARVHEGARAHTSVHHSATHLMHAALRTVLGTHVAQKGSLVNQEHLRFDFSHFAKMTNEEIVEVEKLVNNKIRENLPVVIKELPKEEALKLGAMALFGEKYGDVVRVVIMDEKYSVELCGGTHVGYTGQIGFFKIMSEAAVAAGVRRVEAVCGAAAENYIHQNLEALHLAKAELKNPKDLAKAINQLADENTILRKKLDSLEQASLSVLQKTLAQTAVVKSNNGDSWHQITAMANVGSADALKKLCHGLSTQYTEHAICLTAAIDGKANVAIALSNQVIKVLNTNANKLIKEKVAALIAGGGGGQPGLATAGGQNTEQLQQVLDTVFK